MRKWLPATFLLVLAATLTACPPTPVEKPVIKSFTSSVPGDKLPVGGGDVTLSWTVTGATTVNLAANPASPVPVLNADNVTATVTGVKADTTFTLTATNSAGNAVATKKITVTAAVPAPAITTFQVKTGAGTPSSSVSLPSAGGSVTFNWVVSNATGLSIDNTVGAITPFAATGTKTFTVPAGTTPVTYTMTATGATGSTPATASVTVNRNADTLAPAIASSVPADAATGIAKDLASNLVVTFSEPMNKTATQSAYAGNDQIAPGNVTFSWDTAAGTPSGTVLTINPNTDLAYDAIADPAGPAKVYTYSFTGATDAAGNVLTSGARTFKTLRNITQTIRSTLALSGEVVFSAVPAGNKYFQADIEAGESNATDFPAEIGANYAWKGFAGFDLSSVPAAVAAANLTSANFVVKQFEIAGAPYAAGGLGSVQLEHIVFTAASIDAARFTAYDPATNPSLQTVALSTTAAIEDKSANVLTAVNGDLTNRGTRANRSVYRLVFTTVTNSNATQDLAKFDGPNTIPGGPRLILNYLIP